MCQLVCGSASPFTFHAHHTSHYFFTRMSEPSQGLPYFTIMGYLADQLFVWYDSDARKDLPLVCPGSGNSGDQEMVGGRPRLDRGLEELSEEWIKGLQKYLDYGKETLLKTGKVEKELSGSELMQEVSKSTCCREGEVLNNSYDNNKNNKS
ncbi:class I histocompatibility antigen, F10 alpha chain-like [Pogona vitticeps]